MPKKVLYTASTYGHLSSFHQPYLQWFQSKGWQVHAAAGGERKKLSGVQEYLDLPFKKSITSVGNFKLAMDLSKRLKEERYDLISVHTSLAAFFVRLALRMAGKGDAVVINTVHGYLFDEETPPAKRALLLGAEQFCAGVTDAIFTMNRQDTLIAQKNRLCTGTVEQIDGMGVDFSRFLPPSSEERALLREEFGFHPEQIVLIYAAEFSGRKHQAMLIKALARLPEQIIVCLAGKGDTLEECRRLAASLNVESRVWFPGFIKNIERCYKAADICVSSSRIEGLPFNLMEAMSCGLPVVASSIKGHEDLITTEKNGFLYPYDDEAQFAKYVLKLAKNEKLRKSMGENARNSVKKYDLKLVFPHVTKVLEEKYFR